MKFIPIKTTVFKIPKDNIYDFLDKSLPTLKEGDVLFITSKILAIAQGRCVKVSPGLSKLKLAEEEADYFLKYRFFPKGKLTSLTIKDSVLLPMAGIDESNGKGYYILWPKQTNKLLKEIWSHLKHKYKIKNLAVVATDSRSSPLRRGVTGIATGFFGLEPLRDERNQKDIFDRKLKLTQINIVDALTAAAVLLMGEGNELTPLLICRGAKLVKFSSGQTYNKLAVKPENDIFKPLLKPFLRA